MGILAAIFHGIANPRRRRGLTAAAALVLISLYFAGSSLVQAQQLDQNQLNNVVDSTARAASGQDRAQTAPSIIIEPSAPVTSPGNPSEFEAAVTRRTGQDLRLFGYDDVGVGRSVLLPQMGGVQDNYILGPGDEIVVSLRGQESSETRVPVDRSGRVILPKLAPINAAGRTFGDFRRELEGAVGRSYVATQVFVSIGVVRQIRVSVAGEVNSPGVRVLTGLSSPLEALWISNGVKKTGTLRNIQIVRAGRRIRVDLYGVLRGVGSAQLPLLTDGDQLIVPALGPTVAISGPVRKPAIYELPPGQDGISASSLIALAGGVSIRGRYNLSAIQLQSDGRNQVVNLPNDRALIRDSDMLIIRSNADELIGRVTVHGGGLSGPYSTQVGRLSDILRAPGALGGYPYQLFALISRRDPVTYLRTLIAITPVAILAGRQDFSVQTEDVVYLLDRDTAAQLLRAVGAFDDQKKQQEESVRNPQILSSASTLTEIYASQRGSLSGLGADFENGANSSDANGGAANPAAASSRTGLPQAAPGQGAATLFNTPRAASSGGAPIGVLIPQTANQERAFDTMATTKAITDLANTIQVDTLVLTNFLRDHIVTISGAIRGPGIYLVGPDLDLATLVQAAGGTLGWSDTTGIERVSTSVDVGTGQSRTNIQTLNINQKEFAATIVRPRDQFRFPEVATALQSGTVTLQGEVRHPGVYSVLRGERLSDLLVRAGGLTEVAYPFGAVFLRKSVAALETQGFQREAREIESQLIFELSHATKSSQSGGSADGFAAITSLIEDLRTQKGLGRIKVLADPAVLATQPEQDPILEAGDTLYIPQRPTTVTVLGEVMNGTSIPSNPNLTAADYIAQAGGYTRYADQALTFVIGPDGSARQVETSWLTVGGERIPPGSTIVVPRDIRPTFDLAGTLLQGLQIMSQLAVTTASLAILAKQ